MFKDRNIAILGLGLSGQAALRVARDNFARVFAWDDGEQARDTIGGANNAFICELSESILETCDVLVAAPGIGDDHVVVKRAMNLNIEIICDIELWHRFYPQAKTIGVTGTNGKSTLSSMVQHIFLDNGMQAQLGGNIGTAVFDLPPPQENEWIILELSSFQIERCPSFRPTIAALLNITPDHLDRHKTMDKYAAIKASLFEGDGYAVIAVDDAWTQQIAQLVQVASQRQLCRVRAGGKARLQNEMLAIEIAQNVGLGKEDALKALKSFKPLAHRHQDIGSIDGVRFINDSKATNVEATKGALQDYDQMIWIVGGAVKEGGLTGLEPFVGYVAHACVIGADMDGVADWLENNNVGYTLCGVMEQATQTAYRLAKEKNVPCVMLSPASASYDQYRNFMQRGDDFIVCVQALIDEKEIA